MKMDGKPQSLNGRCGDLIPLELRIPLETLLDLIRAEQDLQKMVNLRALFVSTLDYCRKEGYSASDIYRYECGLTIIMQ